MPSSDARSIHPVLELAYQLAPVKVIDAGAGRGKYGLLIREYVPTVKWVEAIEVHGPYIDGCLADGSAEQWQHRFPPLAAIYDRVHGVPLQTYRRWANFDLALFIDVLEHLPRRQGEELIQRVAETTPAIYCTPRAWFQNPEADRVPSEKHRSLWSEEDFPTGSTHRGDERAVITRVPGGPR